MKKKVWANAVWLLFHTLAEKLKPEYCSELPQLFTIFYGICNNLPCPDCQGHAVAAMQRANKQAVCASKENFITFLWQFHNSVNVRLKTPAFPRAALNARYVRAKTPQVVQHFIEVMRGTSNNVNTMLHAFHRQRSVKGFSEYINANQYKFSA